MPITSSTLGSSIAYSDVLELAFVTTLLLSVALVTGVVVSVHWERMLDLASSALSHGAPSSLSRVSRVPCRWTLSAPQAPGISVIHDRRHGRGRKGRHGLCRRQRLIPRPEPSRVHVRHVPGPFWRLCPLSQVVSRLLFPQSPSRPRKVLYVLCAIGSRTALERLGFRRRLRRAVALVVASRKGRRYGRCRRKLFEWLLVVASSVPDLRLLVVFLLGNGPENRGIQRRVDNDGPVRQRVPSR